MITNAAALRRLARFVSYKLNKQLSIDGWLQFIDWSQFVNDSSTDKFVNYACDVLLINLVAPMLHIGILLIPLMAMLLFTEYHYFTLVYLTWFLCTFNACDTSLMPPVEWLRTFLGQNARYFNLRVIYDGPKLSSDTNYLVGYHPHGIFPVASSLAFGTNFPDDNAENPLASFPLRRWHMAHSFLFKVPIMREALFFCGARAVSERGIDQVLKHAPRGNLVAISPGGLAEMMQCRKGEIHLILRKRRGFIRKAIECGAQLMPSIGFGETELLEHARFDSHHIVSKIQNFFKRQVNFYLPFAYGRWGWSDPIWVPGFQPNRVQLTLCVGDPIVVEQHDNPSDEYIDLVHRDYICKLEQLFHRYKSQYAQHDYKLIIE